MRRILTILALAVLLLSPRPNDKQPPTAMAGLVVRATPLALDAADPGRRQVGALTLLGAWALRSDNPLFGGISSLDVAPDGGIVALSDSGALFGFDVAGHSRRRPFIAPLPVRPAERSWPAYKWDSESMQHDPVTGRYWVGFELIQRICRYGPAFARLESCASPRAMQAWEGTGSVEALVRMPDGRFIAFSEMSYGPYGGNDALLFAGDPADPATPPPVHLAYHPPAGFRPTDALWLGNGALLVLNRRVTPYEGFTAVVALVRLPPLRAGAVLNAQEIARFAPPLLADNFEAMALSHEGGRTLLWIASDDNHIFFQRSLLLKLALPAELDPLRPGIDLLH